MPERPMIGKTTRSQLERLGYGADVETYQGAKRREAEERKRKKKRGYRLTNTNPKTSSK